MNVLIFLMRNRNFFLEFIPLVTSRNEKLNTLYFKRNVSNTNEMYRLLNGITLYVSRHMSEFSIEK